MNNLKNNLNHLILLKMDVNFTIFKKFSVTNFTISKSYSHFKN